jgi:hemoglobin
VGGEQFFIDLVERFYEGVANDPLLRPMYPGDLGPSKQHLARFLSQYWGGPPNYSLERGHPRLRARHSPFSIGEAERDAWLDHMTAAVEAMQPAPREKTELMDYFEGASLIMMNRG